MDIASVNTQTPANAVVGGNASAPYTHDPKQGENQDIATVVKLSSQGQALSQQATRTNAANPTNQNQAAQNQLNQNQVNQNGAANNANKPLPVNVGPQSTATVAAPGIQLVPGESIGGRVNTYA